MTHTTGGYLNINGGSIYYEMAGAGHPLVMVHAGVADRRMWDDQWEAFAQHYRVIRFDMRGFGKSDPANAPLCRRRDLRDLLDQLAIERAHLIGCSMGGEVIIDFALEYPDRVSALIPVCAAPSGFEMQGEPPAYLFEMIAAVEAGDLALASELQTRIWVDGPFRQPEQVDPHVRQKAATMNLIALQNATMPIADAQPLDPLTPPAAGRLGELHMPTLVIIGALDHTENARAADYLTTQIPNAQKAVLDHAAHLPSMDQPAAFNRAVLNFLTA